MVASNCLFVFFLAKKKKSVFIVISILKYIVDKIMWSPKMDTDSKSQVLL